MTDGARTAAPVRDRPTWIAYVQLSSYAWFLYAFGATQALLRDEQGTSRSVAALHGTSLALGGLVAALLASRVIDRWGRGRVMRLTAIGTAGGILVYTVPGGTLPVTLAGAMIATFFGTFLLIAVNAFLLDHHGAAGPSSLTEANAMGSLAGLLGPLAIGLGAATVLGWRVGMWVVVVALVLVEVWRGRDIAVFGTRREAEEEDPTGRLPRRVLWSLAAIVCFLGAEFSLTFWGADLLRVRCDFGPAAAAAALGSVTGGMLVGRLLGARLAERIPTETLLKGSVVCALAAFVIAWSFTAWPLVLLGLFLTGASISVQWPLGVARVVRHSGGLTNRAAAYASVAAAVAGGIAPFALGVLSDAAGIHLAFLLVPLFLVLALAILVIKPVPDAVA